MAGTASPWKKAPYSARVLLYYLVLFFLYRYLIHGYLERSLSRQLLGMKDTLLLSLVLLAYLLLCAFPSWLWSRNSLGHHLSRGVESFICYAAVFLGLGSLYSLAEGGSWKAWYGIVARGGPVVTIFSIGALLLAFLAASWWGGRKDRRRRRGRPRRRGRLS